MAKSMPSKLPKEGMEASESTALTDQSKPEDLSSVELATMATETATVPTFEPPAAALTGSGGATVWLNDKRINATWSINENRNAWVNVTGVGWKKLANNSDSASVALVMLSTHARQLTSPVNYREEADGMIREIYVW